MRVLIDMDGVIADFDKEFLQRWRNHHPEKPKKHLLRQRPIP